MNWNVKIYSINYIIWCKQEFRIMSNLISNLAVEHRVMISDPFIVGFFVLMKMNTSPLFFQGVTGERGPVGNQGPRGYPVSTPLYIIYNFSWVVLKRNIYKKKKYNKIMSSFASGKAVGIFFMFLYNYYQIANNDFATPTNQKVNIQISVPLTCCVILTFLYTSYLFVYFFLLFAYF